MARDGKPWYNRERCAWMVWWNGKKVRLVDGKNDRATAKKAADKLSDLRYEARHNPPPESEPTVASVIEAYLASAALRLAKSTQETQQPYLQSFAEAHGWRRLKEANPTHLEQWLYAHPEWASDWTKNFAVRQVQCVFNWAANKARLFLSIRFGVTHTGLEPRGET